MIFSEILPKILGLLIVFLSIAYLYFKFILYSYWKRKNVPFEEPCVPFGSIGKIIQGKDNLGNTFCELYKKFEGCRFFGAYTFHKPVLVIRDPELAHCVLTRNFTEFHDRGVYYDAKLDPITAHLFFLPGEKWKLMRGKLSPVFTPGKMKQFFSFIQDSAEKSSKTLEEFAKQSKIVDVKGFSSRFTTKIITSVVFGIESDPIENPDEEIHAWGSKIFSSETLRRNLGFFAPSILSSFGISFTEKSVSNFFEKLFREAVEFRDKHNITRGDLLDLLRQLTEESHNPDKKDSLEKTGPALAFGFFSAGFETTLSAITHCLYELAINEEIQERTREDIDKNLERNDGNLDYDVLQDMSYLNKVANEVLRKYPSVAILNRTCTEEFKIPNTNIKVEKGTAVIIPVLGIHMDPKYYTDPEKFDPERFNRENTANRKPYTYLPFGDGPRICIEYLHCS
ncbi:probable cytochrome P450 6d4 isoform X2 [Belonocnema kinseyi]|uniref:probable cytochrome P450 6d4 isoform X2 n=1 Tax=Belonocnema kinseyi TaxID=2817044 RepID=UPI00143D149E|nr:probable cytochrome P450 6d4 isoform X2 [Belonocnema kinseyi]